MMLNAEHINVYYGRIHAVKDVSFHVNEGEIVALIGANGAGKSTTLKTVSGLLHSKTGKIEFMGKDISKAEAYKLVPMGLAHVPEGRRVFLQMTVKENLEMGAYTQSPADTEKDVEDVFTRFPRLRERQNQIAGTLSGGEQQMLAIGRALMSKPELICFDEPSLGLAPIIVDELFDKIKFLNDERKQTILLVEQNVYLALDISSRAYILSSGCIVAEGKSSDLLEMPDIQEQYMGIR